VATEEEIREAAEKVLTPKQLAVFQLWSSGYGIGRIALMLDISRSTARVHLERAQQLVRIELQR
jgi:DNA-binding CsgD family transcriptional regulator